MQLPSKLKDLFVRMKMSINKKCLQCWAEFKTYSTTQIYCSRKCSWLAHRLNYTSCHYCWKTFKPKSKATVYCCNKCRYNGHKLTDIEKTKTCLMCNKPFIKKKARQKYCCKNCSAKWTRLVGRKKEIIDNKKSECLHCRTEFIKHNKRQKYCCVDCARHSSLVGQSKENKRFWKLLTQLGFEWVDEFHLWKYYFDFKIWNILIEVNPYYTHNSTRWPILKSSVWTPKQPDYHYNKYKCAIDNWYKCIMIWDWTSNLIEMVTNEAFHYEGPPQLHYYNPKTGEHITRKNRNKSRIDKWFVEIRDCGKETF